jgi:hypothetical protein
MELHYLIRYTFLACSIGTLAACDSANNGTSTPTTTTISGSVFASPVSNASVSVKSGVNTIAESSAPTGSDGSFTVTLDNTDLASTLVFESTAGTFKDEATGDAGVTAGTMSVMAEANSLSSTSNSVHATPGTTIIRKLVSGGMAMNDAIDAFTTAFGYTPDHSIAPTDTTSPATGAEDAQILAGLRAAAFSQLAMELGLTSDQQFDLFDALTEDLLSDGLLNGAGATSLMLTEDIQNRFATALLNYHNNGLMMPMDVFNPNNQTVLTSDKIGTLPFGKVAHTQDYKVEYLSMMPYVGKTVFTVGVTRLSDSQPEIGLTPTLMPVMNMASMRHDTPVGGVNDNGDGTYDFTIYYLMPNMMGGYWDLGVMLDMSGNNTAHYYPNVMMPMDDTPRVVLNGLAGDDVIPTMLGDQPRPYMMFKESIANSASAGKHDFSVFLVARETMMSHPAIDVGVVLNSGDPTYELTVGTVSVEMFIEQGSNWTPVTVTNDGSGYYSATDISGLSSSSYVDPDTGNTMVDIRIKLSVNGAYKTTDGAAPVTDVNDFQTFKVKLP